MPQKGCYRTYPPQEEASSLPLVLTDCGNALKAEFAAACAELGIRHTRIKPHHAWTNGFGERLRHGRLRIRSGSK